MRCKTRADLPGELELLALEVPNGHCIDAVTAIVQDFLG
jgi:hypothetical protein